MAYTNNSGQVRIGVRSPGVAAIVTTSTLLTSLYSVWNGDTTTSTLDSSIVGAWNGETTSTVTTLNSSVYAAWNGENTLNDSFGTKNGTSVGSVTYATGKVGSNSFNLNGSSYVQLPMSTLNITGDFTVNMWVKVNSTTTTNQGLIGNWRAGYNTGWEILFNNGWLQAFGGNQTNGASGFFVQAPSGNISGFLNTWRMVTFVYKSGVSSYFYVDSTKGGVNNNTHTIPPTTVSNGRIGSEPQDNYHLNGNIDAVTIWNRALSDTEVSALYNQSNGLQYSFPSSISVDIPSANDSVSTNHGTLMNGCTFTTGKLGQAFTFDGVNDYIEFPSNTMNLTGDFTISFWIYMRTRDTNNIMSNHGNDGINRGFYIDSDGSYALRFVANYLAPYYSLIKTDNSALFDLNVWNHYTFISKNGIGQWYKNGVANGASGTVMTNGYITNNKPIIGGYRSGNAGTVGYNKNMALDAFTIWNKAISQDEVTQLYNLGTGTQYPFSGQTLPSANNQFAIDNATLMNGCTFTDGKIGKAFTFDGVNDYVALPDNSLNFTGDFTTSFWFYANAFTSQDSFVTCENWVSPNGNGWYIYHIHGNLGFSVYNGTNATGWKTSTTITTGTWYHVVVIKNRTVSPKFYINGALVGTVLRHGTNITLNPGYVTTQYCSLGTDRYAVSTAHAYLNGKMDGVNVWQREITQSEVTELYNSGAGKQLTVATPIVTNGLVLNLDASRLSSYPNAGTTWADISGNGNNGTMVNGPIFGTANGGVINFDGVNDYVDLGTKSSLAPGTTDFTISFWINPNNWGSLSSTSYSPIFVTLVNGGLWIGKNGANFVLRTAYIADDVQYSVLPTVNQWTMVTVNRVGNIAKIYYNGSVVASATVTRNYVSGNSYLANDIPSGGNYSNIKLSTFSYYNKGLSDSEITQNFNATKSRFGL